MVLLGFFSCLVKGSLARKLFGSVGEALTFREELETRKTFGLVAKALTFGEELMLTRDTLGFTLFCCCSGIGIKPAVF